MFISFCKNTNFESNSQLSDNPAHAVEGLYHSAKIQIIELEIRLLFASKLLNINHFIKKTTEKSPTNFVDNHLNNNKLDRNFKFCHVLSADVSSFANEYTLLGKKNPFKRGIARALLFSRYNKISVTADGKKLGNRLLLCILANGRIYGDGMLCAPKATMTDGLIDVVFLRPMLLWRFLGSLPTYFRREHLESLWFKHKIIYCQAKHINIESKGNLINIGLDGEVVPGTKFSVDILPKAINFRLPKLKAPASEH